MFKLFQEIRNSGRQRSRLIFLVRDREFLTDKVTKQAVVSPPFFQRLKLFCPHAISLLFVKGAAHLFQLYSRATLLEQTTKQKLSL